MSRNILHVWITPVLWRYDGQYPKLLEKLRDANWIKYMLLPSKWSPRYQLCPRPVRIGAVIIKGERLIIIYLTPHGWFTNEFYKISSHSYAIYTFVFSYRNVCTYTNIYYKENLFKGIQSG